MVYKQARLDESWTTKSTKKFLPLDLDEWTSTGHKHNDNLDFESNGPSPWPMISSELLQDVQSKRQEPVRDKTRHT